MILLLNIYAPSSSDVRVVKYSIPIVSQVRGRVIEVPIEEGNRPVKRGDVLFRIDPKPYELAVANLEAQLVERAGVAARAFRAVEGRARQDRGVARRDRPGERAHARSRCAPLVGAQARRPEPRAGENGAGSRFELEKAEADVKELEGQLDSARSVEAQGRAAETQALASEQQVAQRLGAQVKGEFAQAAQVRAQLENARWELEQTVTRSPCDCYVVNLQLRTGGFVAGLPLNPVMTLVEVDGQVGALYHQNELHQVAAGQRSRICAEDACPERSSRPKSIRSSGRMPAGNCRRRASCRRRAVAPPPNRYFVKFDIAEKDRALFLAPGATGDAAIYTDHLRSAHHPQGHPAGRVVHELSRSEAALMRCAPSSRP